MVLHSDMNLYSVITSRGTNFNFFFHSKTLSIKSSLYSKAESYFGKALFCSFIEYSTVCSKEEDGANGY